VEAINWAGSELYYQWYRNTTNSSYGGTSVTGATSNVLTIPDNLAAGNHYFYCNLYVYAPGNSKNLRTDVAMVTVIKSDGADVTTPTHVGSTLNTITINEVAAPSSGQTVEYAINTVNTPYNITSRNITVEMCSNYGWSGASLSISVNGVYLPDLTIPQRDYNSNSVFYKFDAAPDDAIIIYWNKGAFNDQCAFAIYYTDAPPATEFIPQSGYPNDYPALLLYKHYGTLDNSDHVAQRTLLGSFSVTIPNTWQSELTFDELTPGTDYYIFAHSKENANQFTGAPSPALQVATIDKSPGTDVTTPTLASKSHNIVTINEVPVPASGQIVEYAISESDIAPETGWQTNLTFTYLTANLDYYIFARSKENNAFHA
jgi:hypothetical protein